MMSTNSTTVFRHSTRLHDFITTIKVAASTLTRHTLLGPTRMSARARVTGIGTPPGQAITLLLSLVLWFAIQVFAQVPATNAGPVDLSKKSLTQYKIDGWQTEQGLPLNTVQATYQTRDGYLWVGTTAGLARFDGIRFETFDATVVPELLSRTVFGFMEDADGNLWIGHGRGAARFRNGRFEPAFDNALVEGRRVWAFAQANDGVIWAASENGLVRWEKGKNGEGIARVYKEADGLPTNRLRSLAFDKDGTLWIGTTGGGLVSFAAGKFRAMNPTNGFPHLEVRHVLADPAGGIWAATAGAGLVHVKDGQIKSYTTADGLPTDQLTYLARDKAGALWIGTWGSGVARMSDGKFSSISTAGGLAGDQIWSLVIDREGSVWVGTWNGGLNRLSNRAFGVFGKPEGLSSDNTRSVLHARDGATWVSTAGGGVNKIVGGRITVLAKKNGLATDESSALLEDREGAIWIGSYTGGVARLKQGKLEKFGVSQGLPNVDIRVLYQDRAGTIWVGTKSGLARFDEKARSFSPVSDAGAPREGVVSILEDRAGVMWFGTAGLGLVRYRDGIYTTMTRKDGLVSNWILAIYEDAAGTLWIGTNGEGFNRIKNDRLTAIRPADGLWDGTVQVIIEDRQGDFWVTCNRGFFRVARAELDAFAEGRIAKVKSTGFGPGDALRSTTFAGGLQPAGSMDAAGHLWLPSLQGLVIVDPMHLPGEGQPPQVMIEAVSIDGVSTVADKAIILPPGSVPLSIRYSAGTLLNADRVRFRYQMEGITQNWVDAGKSREASFPALPHGAYQFRVAATLDGKRWQEAISSLPITVQPYYYQTFWFLALAILATIAAVAGLFRLRTHQLRLRHIEMERVVAEKTEALRLANEHLSRLSFADALTGLANRRRLDETLETEWRRASRLQTPLAVVIADIDAFKAYNDSLGHPEGDKCLIAVANVIREAANRAGDFAARYGGEEFIILIPGLDLAAVTAFAEVIRQACEARAIPHPASPVAPVVTISLGVAVRVPSDQSTVEALVADADAALYRAKNQGRNRVRS
ncbi:MAG: two-component regulator propeller domain-containing protein [Betaproteobacteria bacterium]